MCISMFYAQVMGLWLFLVSLAMLVHHVRFRKTVAETLGMPGMMTYTGLIALLLGLLVVVSHNIWVSAWPVLITLVGWILMIQGILRIYWPESFAKMMRDLMAGNGFTIMNWIWFLVGLYLMWCGFMS
jgi:hypothetical protein